MLQTKLDMTSRRKSIQLIHFDHRAPINEFVTNVDFGCDNPQIGGPKMTAEFERAVVLLEGTIRLRVFAPLAASAEIAREFLQFVRAAFDLDRSEHPAAS